MISIKQFKLNRENYHSLAANTQFWSASLVKEFLSCESRAMAILSGEYERPKTDALMVGSYVDAAFESKAAFDRYVAAHASEIIKRDGKPKAEYARANEMIARAKSDATFMRYMSGRKQVVMIATLFGVPFKCRYDVLRDSYKTDPSDRRIVDLKTVKDFKPVYIEGQGKLDFASAWNWPLQMAIYQAIYEQRKGVKLPTFLACITKEDPPDIAVIRIPQAKLDAEMDFLAAKMERFKAIRAGIIEPERCENCAWCRLSKKLTDAVELYWMDME